MNRNNTSLANFTPLSVIGKGSYAKVMLVKKNGSPKTYAMKILKKKHIAKTKQQAHVMTQRNVLARVHHPFIVQLHWSFQNDQKLFFVLDYCPGGELFGLLSKRNRLTEDQTRFYAAQLVLALQYLHSKDILYREYSRFLCSLKPQNVLLDRRGYVKLTDFGLSRFKLAEKDVSVCGTPEYLAPEIIQKSGHSKEVDWWCLGCLIYQMVTGIPPFSAKNRTDLFSKIVQDQPKMPVYLSFKLKSLLEGFLKKSPKERLGANSASEVKNHPWFDKIDFDQLLEYEIEAPFVPHLKSDVDVSNFDTQFTQCEIDSYGDNTDLEEASRFKDFSFDEDTMLKRCESIDTEASSQFEMKFQ